MVFDAAFWATIALFVFLGGMLYLKVPAMITVALDGRIKKIEAELAEAERLRVEAKSLLEEYESKREAAKTEAEGIVTAAREEAFRLTAEAKTDARDTDRPPHQGGGRKDRAGRSAGGRRSARALRRPRRRSGACAAHPADGRARAMRWSIRRSRMSPPS